MNRIEIRGVIVPSEYDSDWTKKYIEKGIITPESTFRSALKNASGKEPLEIYINSPGGSVFSAYEMVNAVREWKSENKQPVNVIIGAMAASAASIVAIFIGSSIKAHRNAKMMFHGASTITIGGKEAHEDEASLLGKINAEVQQALIQKYKMNPDLVAEWFAEGRMGWLTAEEMFKANIISEIIPDDSEVIKFDTEEIKAIGERGLDIAALMEEPKDGIRKPVENSASNIEPQKPSGINTENSGKDKSTADAKKEDYARGLKDGKTEAETGYSGQLVIIADKIKDLTAKNEALDAQQRKFQGERDSARAQVEKLDAALKEATAKLEQMLAGGMKFSPAIETWEDAMKECGNNYEEARKQFPDLYRAERERAKANRK